MATLESIIKSAASRCGDIGIKVCRKYGTVTISDLTGANEDIFMQGDDADKFIAEMDCLVEQAPDVLMDEAVKAVAEPYVSCLWH